MFRRFGGACVKQHFPNCTGSDCFSSVCCRWDGLFCRYVCGGLKRQSETRFALLARHHKLISCPTMAPTELVYVCTVQVLFQSRRIGIAPPPISFYLYCTDVITVEERGHSPPPPSLEVRAAIGTITSLSARGRSSRGIYHSSTFYGGGVF